MKTGFDNDKYLHMQSEHINERIAQFGGKLYLEFGGKLFDDYHASRVLPGFEPDSKLKMLLQLKERVEIVIVINSSDIEKNKLRSDIGITYDLDVIRLIDCFRSIGLYVGSVVMTRFNGQATVVAYQKRLESLGVKVYRHYSIDGYPSDIAKIVSDEGYGKNEYIETSRELVVITAPGPGSGKMATCMSQLYHEHKRGVLAGYAKFETFPIWNVPLTHPVNLAYEAATADLNDVNMIDPYHLEAYGKSAVNYNRDIEIFPVLNAMFEKIYGTSPYKSPTDMGVNMAGFCITDDEVCRKASCDEVVRRYFAAKCAVRQGHSNGDDVYKIEILMSKLGITPDSRVPVSYARNKAEETGEPAMALELADGRVVTGKTTDLLGAGSALLLNALKLLADIPEETLLIPPEIITPIHHLKVSHMGHKNPRMHTDELLIALSICGNKDENAALAIEQLDNLRGAEAHSTVLLARVDENVFKKLGINLTCDPVYQRNNLYHR